MIEFLSVWVKGIGITIIIASIIEMLLPKNKIKKYIQMMLGIFVIFNIVAPLVQNKSKFNLSDISLEKYETIETSSNIDASKTISKIYEKELEEDIKSKLEEKGYEVKKCLVLSKNEYEITKISLEIGNKETTEEKLVTQIEKIKKIDVNLKQEEKEDKIPETNYKEIQEFLIKEYGVDRKCLEIN